VQRRPGTSATLRASDADRERTARALGAHLAEGRLTFEEFSERLDSAYGARTLGELRELTADLPGVERRPARTPQRPRGPFWPGNLPFATHIRTSARPSSVMDAARRTIVPRLVAGGYRLEASEPRRLTFAKTHRPAWTIVVAILTFPIGLLALLYTVESQVVIGVEVVEGETTVEVSGTAPLGVRRAVRQLAL
jgi:hypothetical protein